MAKNQSYKLIGKKVTGANNGVKGTILAVKNDNGKTLVQVQWGTFDSYTPSTEPLNRLANSWEDVSDVEIVTSQVHQSPKEQVMSETKTATATETQKPVVKKPVSKKPVATKPTEKAPEPAPATPVSNPPVAETAKPSDTAPVAATPKKTPFAKKDGLRAPQVRILKALAKAGKAMTRPELSKAAPVDQAACVEYIGSSDEQKRLANDKKHFPSLISLGFVQFGKAETEGGTAYEITAAGKTELEKLEKAEATPEQPKPEAKATPKPATPKAAPKGKKPAPEAGK